MISVIDESSIQTKKRGASESCIQTKRRGARRGVLACPPRPGGLDHSQDTGRWIFWEGMPEVQLVILQPVVVRSQRPFKPSAPSSLRSHWAQAPSAAAHILEFQNRASRQAEPSGRSPRTSVPLALQNLRQRAWARKLDVWILFLPPSHRAKASLRDSFCSSGTNPPI